MDLTRRRFLEGTARAGGASLVYEAMTGHWPRKDTPTAPPGCGVPQTIAVAGGPDEDHHD